MIVATQVLESMRTEPRPTRAEVSDAANAVDDGVDAIMLAGETAAGAYPVRAVQTLDLVICEAESMPSSRSQLERPRLLSGHQRAVCEAAVTLAERGDAAAIVAVTRGGTTARVLSALRTRVPIFAATDRPEIARRLALPWGVVPVLTEIGDDVATTGKRNQRRPARSPHAGARCCRGVCQRVRGARPRADELREAADDLSPQSSVHGPSVPGEL